MSFYCNTKVEQKEWIKHLEKVCILERIEDDYTFDEIIGQGSFAKVYLSSRKDDNKKFAIKAIRKSLLLSQSDNMECVIMEINVLRRLDHPNIVKLYKVYESEHHIYLVMEYVQGGDLLGYFRRKGTYSEKDASLVVLKVLEVLDYCHSRNVIHRDLKPENLMLM